MLHFILDWIGISVDYLIAAAFFFGGGALLYFGTVFAVPVVSSLVKYVAYVLMIIGVVFGFFSYGKSVGAADCYAAWHQADVAMADAKQKQETDAQTVASQTASAFEKKLADQGESFKKQIAQYESKISKADNCRSATVDDNRRLCNIVGDGIPGCENSK